MTKIATTVFIWALALISAIGLSANPAQAQPVFTTSFSPTEIGPGGTATLTYLIDNGAGTATGAMSFTNVLPNSPSAMTIADGSATHTCGAGTLSAPSGGSTVSFSNGEIGAGLSCTITVNVTAPSTGTYTNPAVTLSTSQGDSFSSPVDLIVDSDVPAFSKAFAPNPITVGQTSTLTLTVDNSANTSAILNLDFTDNLPSGVTVASPANASTDCENPSIPASLSASPGSSTIVLDADGVAGFPALAAGSTCTVSVDVTSSAVGSHFNSVTLLADFDDAGIASDTLVVEGVGDDNLLISKEFTDDPTPAGGTATLEFTIRSTSRTSSATGISFTDDLNAMLTGATLTGTPPTDPCGAGSTVSGTSTLTLAGGSLAAEGSCTFAVTVSVPGTASAGTYNNVTSNVTGTIDGSGVTGNVARNSLTVIGAQPLDFTAAYVPSSADLGDTVVLRYTISNPNPSGVDATDVAFRDELTFTGGSPLANGGTGFLPFPVDLGALPTNPCGGGSSVTVISFGTSRQGILMDGGSVSGGNSCIFDVPITMPTTISAGNYSSSTGNLSATLSGATIQTSPATANITLAGGVELVFRKSFTDDPVNAGGTARLVFTIENSDESTVAATDIAFSDDLTGMSIAGVTATVVPAPGDPCGAGSSFTTSAGDTLLSLTGGTLAIGDSCTFSVDVSVPGGTATGDYDNTTSTLSASDGSQTISAPAASDTLSVLGVDDQPLTIAKEFLQPQLVPGAASTIRFTISNGNQTNAGNINFFTDNLSAALSGMTATANSTFNDCGGTMSRSGGNTVLTYTGGSVAAGASCIIEVPVLVPAAADAGRYQNVTSNLLSTVGGGSQTSAPATARFEVVEEPVTLAKSFTNNPVQPGGTATLEFTITNVMDSADATHVSFTDDLDAMLSGATFQGGTNDCGLMSPSSPGDGTFQTGAFTLAAATSCTITINVAIPGGAAEASYPNTTSTIAATVQGVALTGTAATDTLVVSATSDPSFSKAFGGPVAAGNPATLTFTITNNDGSNPISALRFLDDLDAMLSGATASSLPSDPCGTGSSLSGTDQIELVDGNIAAGGSCTFDVTVNVPATATPGDHINTTSNLSQGGVGVAGPATATLTVVPPPGFSKAFSKDTATQGEVLTLSLTIDNSASTLVVENIAVVDNFPTGLELFSLPNDAGCSTSTLTGEVGDTTLAISDMNIVPGGTCVVTAQVRVTGASDLVNTTGDLTSSLGNSGSASDSLTVIPADPLTLAKAFSQSIAATGESLEFTLEIENPNTFAEATSVAFTDTLPAGLIIATAPTADANCGSPTLTGTVGDSAVSFSGGEIATGVLCTVTVGVTVTGTTNQTNEVTDLTSSLGNSPAASATLTVVPPGPLGLSKSFSETTAAEGQSLTMTVEITNGDLFLDATGISFTDNFAKQGIGLVIASDATASSECVGGTLSGGVGKTALGWTGGTLVPGETCIINVGVTVTEPDNILNTIDDLTSSLGDSAPASASLTVNGATVPGFAKAFADTAIDLGDQTTLTFTIDNSANLVEAIYLDFTDPFPAGLVIAATPNLTNTCGGTVTTVAGGSRIALTNGTVGASASCLIAVDVRAETSGDKVNVSGNLTSNLGDSGTAQATLEVTSTDAPFFLKEFLAIGGEVQQGETTVLHFLFDANGRVSDVTDMAFTDPFPDGLVVADDPNVTNICGGTFTAVPGSTSVSLVDGSMAADEYCEIFVNVRVIGSQDIDNVTSVLTSSTSGDAAPATASLAVIPAEAPGFAKAFADAVIDQGETTGLTFTIDNSANAIEAADVAFVDSLPPGMIVAADSSDPGTCTGGVVTANAGEGTISLQDLVLPAGESCSFDVTVQALEADTMLNVTSELTSSLPTAAQARASLTVNENPLDVGIRFTPATIEQFQTSTMTYSFTNIAVIDAFGVYLSDTLPAGMTVADPAVTATNCPSGTLSAPAGGDMVTYSGGTLAAGASCEISVAVTSGVVGSYANATETAASSLGTSANPSATLTVDPATTGSLIVVQSSDEDGDYAFSSSETALNFTITTAGGTGSFGPITLTAGSYLISQSMLPAGVGTSAITCDDGNSIGDASARTIQLELEPLETVTCTVTSKATLAKTMQTINRFMTTRANLMLSTEPGSGRRFDRLNRGSGNASPLSFASGDLKSFLPFQTRVSRGGEELQFSTSLLKMRQAAASLQLAHSDDPVMYVDNYRFDAWTEVQYKKFDSVDSRGHFAVAYFGVDYLATPDVLVGALLQFDDMSDHSESDESRAYGSGWMFGPYVTARITPSLYFDGRLAAGRSYNVVSPFDTYEDDFTTSRWLAQGSLTGEFKRGSWTIRPAADLSYFRESQDGYTDSLGVDIPGQTIELGQLKLGPTFNGSFETGGGLIYSPFFGIDAIYSMGGTSADVTLPDGIEEVTEEWRARMQAGVDFTTRDGTRIAFSSSYDGIGQEDFEAWGLSLNVTIPLQKTRAR